jgi:hypothetical protein
MLVVGSGHSGAVEPPDFRASSRVSEQIVLRVWKLFARSLACAAATMRRSAGRLVRRAASTASVISKAFLSREHGRQVVVVDATVLVRAADPWWRRFHVQVMPEQGNAGFVSVSRCATAVRCAGSSACAGGVGAGCRSCSASLYRLRKRVIRSSRRPSMHSCMAFAREMRAPWTCCQARWMSVPLSGSELELFRFALFSHCSIRTVCTRDQPTLTATI